MKTDSGRYEYFRFPLISTLLSGVFLILILRVYWEPRLYIFEPQMGEQSFLSNYSIWGPVWRYGFERLKGGGVPHWNPYSLCGHPYLVDYRMGLFQPWSLFFYLVDFGKAYQVTVLMGTFLVGIGYVILGRIWGIDFLALIPAAVALMFSGFVVWAQGSITYLNGCVGLSLLLSGLMMFLELRSVRSAFVLLILWCILILSGSMECILAGALLLLVFPLLMGRLNGSRGRVKMQSWFMLVLVMILGIVLTSFCWFPSLMWKLTEGDGDIVGWLSLGSVPITPNFPLSLKEFLLQLVDPLMSQRAGSIPIFFVGLIPLTMVVPAFFGREFRRVAFIQVVIIVFCLVFYYLDLRIAKSLRAGMGIVLVQSVLLLFSIGYNRTFLKGSDITSPYIWGSVLVMLIASGIMIFLGNVWAKGILIVFVSVMFPISLLRFRWIKFVGCVVASLIIFLELFYPLRQLLPVDYVSAINWLDVKSKSLQELKIFTAGGRTYIQVGDGQGLFWSENLGADLKWQLANGRWEFVPEGSKQWQELLYSADEKRELKLRVLTASGVRWVCSSRESMAGSSDPSDGWRIIEKFPHVVLKENPNSLPMAFIVSDVKRGGSVGEIMTQIINGEVDLSRTCMIDGDISIHINKEASFSHISCIVDLISPEHIVVNIPSPAEGILILLDTYSSGWRAMANGEELKVYRVNGIFKGVYVSPEMRKVEFFYSTPWWKESLIISVIGFVMNLVFFGRLGQRLMG